MTKANIMNIIKENNQNKSIKWSVLENTKDIIVLTNDYDKSIRFEIKLHEGDSKKDIRVRDEGNLPKSIGYLMNGTEFWADFSDEEVGITQAVKKVVRFFYYYY